MVLPVLTPFLIKSSAQFNNFQLFWERLGGGGSFFAVLHPQMLTTSKVDLPPEGCPERNYDLIVRYL